MAEVLTMPHERAFLAMQRHHAGYRTVGIFKGRGRYAVLVGVVILNVNDPDCLKWGELLRKGLTAQTVDFFPEV